LKEEALTFLELLLQFDFGQIVQFHLDSCDKSQALSLMEMLQLLQWYLKLQVFQQLKQQQL
jgi:hypothetical protein